MVTASTSPKRKLNTSNTITARSARKMIPAYKPSFGWCPLKRLPLPRAPNCREALSPTRRWLVNAKSPRTTAVVVDITRFHAVAPVMAVACQTVAYVPPARYGWVTNHAVSVASVSSNNINSNIPRAYNRRQQQHHSPLNPAVPRKRKNPPTTRSDRGNAKDL